MQSHRKPKHPGVAVRHSRACHEREAARLLDAYLDAAAARATS
jgi:hypothetical protein